MIPVPGAAGRHCGPAGNNPGPGSRRTNHHQRTAETHLLLVGNRTVDYGNLHQVFLGILHAFGNSRSNLRSLTQTVAYHTILVADDHDGREAERATALRYLGNTLNAYEPVFELEVACAYFLHIGICHIALEFKTAFTSGVC